jgi:hypothetical protein
MVRSAAQRRVSNHEAATSFETHRFAMLLRMRRNKPTLRRPYSLPAPGRPSSIFAAASKSTEGARDARVQTDPRTSTPRSIEAAEVRITASPPFPWRPARGVCEVCSASPPGGRPFVAFKPNDWAATLHRLRTRHTGPAASDRRPGPSAVRALGVRLGTPGPMRLGPPAGVIGAASPTPPTGHRFPPRVWRRLIRRPSVTGRDVGI